MTTETEMPPPAAGVAGVELVEVGPRDGLQNERRTLPVETRVELVSRLLDLGLRRIEAASFVRPDRVPQMAGAEDVLAALPDAPGATYVGLVLNGRGAQRAALTRCGEINVVVPVTDAFSARNQGTGVAGMLGHAGEAVRVARESGMTVSVTLAVAFGCPFTGPVPAARVAEVIDQVLDLGIDELALADTIGVGVPRQVLTLGALALGDPRVPALRFHFHNTRNTGYANAWAATELDVAGHGQRLALDASLGGFGGCPFAPAATGNIATEDLLHLLRGSEVPVRGPAADLDLEAATTVAAWLAGELDSPVQALVGRAGAWGRSS